MARWSAQVRSAQGPTGATSSPTLVEIQFRLGLMNRNVMLSRGTEYVVAAWISRLAVRAGLWEMCRMMRRLVR